MTAGAPIQSFSASASGAPPVAGASVRLRNLSKTYVDERGRPVFHAVKGINLEIQDGELLVLVGPSGCGKSTTLRMIAGLEKVSGGTIEIGGQIVNQVEPKDRGIAMVFQNYALYPHMTVFDNLAFGLKLAKKEKSFIRQAVLRAAATLGLEALLRPQTPGSFRRTTPARGAGTRHRPKSQGVSLRRTALQSGRQDARADARGDCPSALQPQDHHDLCDARPGRSDDDGRPHLRHARGRPHANSRPAHAVPAAAKSFCRRIHRQSDHEPSARTH